MIGLEALREKLGGDYTFDGDDEQVRVLDKSGCDIAFVDLASGIIEHELNVKWHDSEAGLCASAADQAQTAVDDELRQIWEEAEFDVSESGSMSEYWCRNAPEKKFPLYKVEVTKEVGNAKEAAEAVSWIRYAENTA